MGTSMFDSAVDAVFSALPLALVISGDSWLKISFSDDSNVVELDCFCGVFSLFRDGVNMVLEEEYEIHLV